MQLVFCRRCELFGTHVRARESVGEAGPDGHDRLPGEDASAEHLALGGLGIQLDPRLEPTVVDQFKDVGFLGTFPGRIDDDVERAAVGQQADAVAGAFGQAHVVEQGVGALHVELAPCRLVLRPIKRTFGQDRVGALAGEAEIDDLVYFVAVDRQGKGAPEPHVPKHRAPDRIGGIQIGIERLLRPLCGAPQADGEAVALLALFKEGVVVESQIPGLQVRVPGPRLGRNHSVGPQGDDHPVDVGELPARRVDAVVVRIAGEDEAFGRRPGRVHPGLERRQAGTVGPVLAILGRMQYRPVAHSRIAHLAPEHGRIGVADVKPLQIVGRPVDEQRRRRRQRRHEIGIGPGPGVADRCLIQDLESRRLSVDEQHLGQPERRQLGVSGHVLPVVAEVLGRKGMAIGPPVSLSETQGEFAALADIKALEDVGNDLQSGVVRNQAGIAVHHHHAHVLGLPHEQAQIAAIAPEALPRSVQRHDGRGFGHPFPHRRQIARRHRIVQEKGLQQLRRPGRRSRDERPGEDDGGGDQGPGPLHDVSIPPGPGGPCRPRRERNGRLPRR